MTYSTSEMPGRGAVRAVDAVSAFARQTVAAVRADGLDALEPAGRQVYHKLLQQGCRVTAPGTNIYEEEWDLCIVLDACRFDLFAAAMAEGDYEFAAGRALESRRSRQSVTRLWMQNTFTDEHAEVMANTHYVCGNPWSAEMLDAERFAGLDEVWRYGWDDTMGTLPARAVTDRAIAAGRSDAAFDRLVVHYMQPHCPFVPAPELSAPKRHDTFTDAPERDVWMRLQAGELDADEVYAGYYANLQYALADVDLLLANVDAERVVITSDHGNAMGEYGLYGHPESMPFDVLRTVPWLVTAGVDIGSYEPLLAPDDAEHAGTDADIDARLAALGYL